MVIDRRYYTITEEVRLGEVVDAFPEADRSNYFGQDYRLVGYKGSFDVGRVRIGLTVQKGVSYVSVRILDDVDSVDSIAINVEFVHMLRNKFPSLRKLVKCSGGSGFGNA